MKVNIYETIEVSDEQRVQIARSIDPAGAKKRQATRDEIKQFVWNAGAFWADELNVDQGEPDTGPEPEATDDDIDVEDMLG